MLFEFLFPYHRHCAVYDHVHPSKGAHTLDASITTIRDRSPGGKQRKQRKQRDTTYSHFATGEKLKQSLVNELDVAKGLLAILLKRGEQLCHVEPRLQGPGFKFVERAHLLPSSIELSWAKMKAQ
jgi:hypothetical protein